MAKSLAYGAVEVLTAGRGVPRRVCGESIRFPARWSRYYEPDYEPETFTFLREHCRAGATVLDIGAHIGLFSVLMARLVGPAGMVYAFEPTPATRDVLRRTVRLNGVDDRVEVRGEAAARSSGSGTFFDTGDPGSNANSLVATRRHRGEIRVATTSVDDFTRARDLRIGCLKIDVEGSELSVLQGALNVLDTDRPVVALALHPDAIRAAGGSLEEIWTLVCDQNMSVSKGGRLVGRDWFCSREGLFDVQCLPTIS